MGSNIKRPFLDVTNLSDSEDEGICYNMKCGILQKSSDHATECDDLSSSMEFQRENRFEAENEGTCIQEDRNENVMHRTKRLCQVKLEKAKRQRRRSAQNAETSIALINSHVQNDQKTRKRRSKRKKCAPTVVEEYKEEREEGCNKRSSKIVMLSDFEPQYYLRNSEAFRGNKHGSLAIPLNAPGIPRNKFNAKDLHAYSTVEKHWPVQSVYDTDNKDYKLVLYEGWSSDTASVIEAIDLKATAPEMYKRCILRNKIVSAIEYHSNGKKIQSRTQTRFSATSTFWCFEDLAYFHTLENEKVNWAPIFYTIPDGFAKTVAQNNFPNLTYVTSNIVSEKALTVLKNNSMSISIHDVLKNIPDKSKSFGIEKNKGVMNSCLSEDCKCNIREEYVYAQTNLTRLRYNDRGALRLSNYEMDTPRFVIECSDACGCDAYCPNRRSQRGQKVPLVVNYEGNPKNFGLRAGQSINVGEFVAEYQGVVCLRNEIESERYLMDVTTVSDAVYIDSTTIGNVGRYINHSCEPNVMFIEIHSREFEDDVLIPKVGIFAIKNIVIGEEICVSYYSEEELEKAASRKSKRTTCHCNAPKCKGWLPTEF